MGTARSLTTALFRSSRPYALGWMIGSSAKEDGRRWRAGSCAPIGAGVRRLPVRLSGEMSDLHDWRKRVKDLWYHERLLAPTCGPTVRGHAKELDRLSDLLGDDHDLALLRHELTRRAHQRRWTWARWSS